MPAYRYQQGDRPLEGYTIQHALGRGGFGEVYFAISDAGREVALKAIQNYEEIELRGIGHCMNLKSPHLVMIFDVKQDAEGMAWVIMEYVSGANLREILDEAHVGSSLRDEHGNAKAHVGSYLRDEHQNAKANVGSSLRDEHKNAKAHVGSSLRDEHENAVRLGETDLLGIGVEQAAYFTRELCKGLSYLHDAGVVHRDLKPHNVFFEDGVVKIGDYSLSKAITTSHRSGHTTTVGSVHYMAPEICEGRYGKTVDIYALGVMLFEMLTGSPPYEGESMGEVLMKHLSSQPDVSGLPEPFGRVVAKAMHRDPEKRYQTASEMMRALSPADELEYSRPPASLSMIGDRALKGRAIRVRESETPACGSKDALAETYATPVALRDTHERTDSVPFERPGAVSFDALGLWWKRQPSLALEDDPVPVLLRLAIAVVISLLSFSVGCVTDPNSWFWGDVLTCSIVFASYNALTCWFFLSTLPRSGGLGWAIVTRIIAVVPLVVVSGILVTWHGFEFYHGMIGGLIAVYAILDARCLVTADRYPRISLMKTLLAGGIAAVITTLIGGSERYTLFSGILAVSSAIAVQVLAPLGRVVRVNLEANRANRNTTNQSDGQPRSEDASNGTDQPMVISSSVDPSVTN
ncbi:Serine/threonine-protein kinase PrkC [Novipirellula aureliae]|uniref:Serine/threonine-protein kinase PrkC n=1 Tax=Novipirellula aureliae TaxID=2527966 RepID=A0A5C6DFJ4_9BACT|nr:serine/threonine-protein kinase [Novipirellula aureliae]TWU34577.1 Serine/threonine-protein kinase PrkC [Novipirellula aureliae]